MGDLFTSSSGDYDIKKEHINDKGDYVITAGLSNNGVLGKTDVKAKVLPSNTITVDMFGYVFYRQFQYKMVTHARVFSIKPKFKITSYQGQFLSSTLHFLNKQFGYQNMCTWEKVKEKKIQLPIKADKEIDFDFMETFITKIEAQRIKKLEAYLIATGLNDYQLNEQENEALLALSNGEVEFKDFKIIDIFNVKNTYNILSRDIVENSGSTPYLSAGRDNNSVSSYISYSTDYLDKGNCIFIGGKTFVVTYQEQDFFSNDSHNLCLYLKNKKSATKLNQLFMISCIEKGLKHQYSWGNSISNRKIQKDVFLLPTKNSQPDFNYMQTLISAVQKLVIKEVVTYSQQKMQAYKQMVN